MENIRVTSIVSLQYKTSTLTLNGSNASASLTEVLWTGSLREDEPLELLLLFLVVRPNPRLEIPPTGMSCGDPPTPMLWVKKEHLEGFVDPADDFPYNIGQSQGSFVRTVPSRTLNEIFKRTCSKWHFLSKEGDDPTEYS
jgi:hypothetical protein